jgi:hypothetical protein
MFKEGDYVTFVKDEDIYEDIYCMGYILLVEKNGTLLVKITQADKPKYVGQTVIVNQAEAKKTRRL